jgi:hypothetical protein
MIADVEHSLSPVIECISLIPEWCFIAEETYRLGRGPICTEVGDAVQNPLLELVGVKRDVTTQILKFARQFIVIVIV